MPRSPGGAHHGGGKRAVTSQPRTGQSTLYGDVKPSYGGAGGWDKRGCVTGAPRSANKREGGCLLMALSVCAAFGGCCDACTSWFPCVLLCVLLGLVSLPCVGQPYAQLLCCLRSSQCRASFFLLARSLLLVCGVGGGGAACRSLYPLVAVGLSHLQLGGTRGTGHFCTCLQIYKLTCHWCLLGLFWGECGALLLFCFLGC